MADKYETHIASCKLDHRACHGDYWRNGDEPFAHAMAFTVATQIALIPVGGV